MSDLSENELVNLVNKNYGRVSPKVRSASILLMFTKENSQLLLKSEEGRMYSLDIIRHEIKAALMETIKDWATSIVFCQTCRRFIANRQVSGGSDRTVYKCDKCDPDVNADEEKFAPCDDCKVNTLITDSNPISIQCLECRATQTVGNVMAFMRANLQKNR